MLWTDKTKRLHYSKVQHPTEEDFSAYYLLYLEKNFWYFTERIPTLVKLKKKNTAKKSSYVIKEGSKIAILIIEF
jgi:hypothetical protein